MYYGADGNRRFKTFGEYQDAKNEAEKVNASFSTGNADTLVLSSREAAAYRRAADVLRPINISVDQVASEYAQAQKILDGSSLIEAVRYYARRYPKSLPRKTVSEIVEELIQAKMQGGASYFYVNDLKKLRIFARAFACQLASVAGMQIDDWLRSLDVKGRTRNNYRLLIQTLFNFAKARRYLPADHNEMTAVAVAHEQETDIEIFTPKELLTWLNGADPHLIPFITIGAFSGVRHWEIKRLD